MIQYGFVPIEGTARTLPVLIEYIAGGKADLLNTIGNLQHELTVFSVAEGDIEPPVTDDVLMNGLTPTDIEVSACGNIGNILLILLEIVRDIDGTLLIVSVVESADIRQGHSIGCGNSQQFLEVVVRDKVVIVDEANIPALCLVQTYIPC